MARSAESSAAVSARGDARRPWWLYEYDLDNCDDNKGNRKKGYCLLHQICLLKFPHSDNKVCDPLVHENCRLFWARPPCAKYLCSQAALGEWLCRMNTLA